MHIDALIHTFRLLDIADILIVAVGIYYLYKLLKDTRAVSLLKGLVIVSNSKFIESFAESICYQLDFATKYDRSSLRITCSIPTGIASCFRTIGPWSNFQ